MELLLEVDSIFHQRVNFTLLAESIFVVAATTVWQYGPAVVLLSAFGVAFVTLLTVPTVKMYWRLALLIQVCKEEYPAYKDFVTMRAFKKARKSWSPPSQWLYKAFLSPQVGEWRPSWRHTGWQFSWGIFWTCVIAWGAILFVRFAFPP